jgi:hypothetical protein
MLLKMLVICSLQRDNYNPNNSYHHVHIFYIDYNIIENMEFFQQHPHDFLFIVCYVQMN